MPSATKIVVGVLRPSSRNGRERPKQPANQHGERQRAPELAEIKVTANQGDNVAGDAKEQRLAEAHDAGKAPAQVEADGEHRQDQQCSSSSVISSVRSRENEGRRQQREQRHELD